MVNLLIFVLDGIKFQINYLKKNDIKIMLLFTIYSNTPIGSLTELHATYETLGKIYRF